MEEDIQNCLPTVMFRGTPCISPQFFFNRFESEFSGFEPRLQSAQNQFLLSAGLNIKTLNSILSGTNRIWAAFQIYAVAEIR